MLSNLKSQSQADYFYAKAMNPSLQDAKLRDFFAAQALPSIFTLFPDSPKERIAKEAYEMADALLEARNHEEDDGPLPF